MTSTSNRRRFLWDAAAMGMMGIITRGLGADVEEVVRTGVGGRDVGERIRGLMYGTLYGDALGGPIEFQDRGEIQKLPHPPKVWRDEEVLDAPALTAAASRLRLRPYAPLRPKPESYGQWAFDGPPGTVTDDSRHKFILLHALAKAERTGAWPLTLQDFARAHLDWPGQESLRRRPGYVGLMADWLEEWQLSARWVLGERDLSAAKPPERMWIGIPTCCGQMTLPPLAALFPGQPEKAYLAAYHLAFFDNGWGRDMNAALVAGLAKALVVEVKKGAERDAWVEVMRTMRSVDPYGYSKVRWSHRSVDRWMDLALKFAKESDRRPARFFERLESEFKYNSKWEAQVPFLVVFGCLELAGYDSLAALELSLEWGWDTDSYAQLLGAFAGAIHGPNLFPKPERELLVVRLKEDYGVELEGECDRLIRLSRLSANRELVEKR